MKKIETILFQVLIFVKYLCGKFSNVNIINILCLLLLLFDKLIYYLAQLLKMLLLVHFSYIFSCYNSIMCLVCI